jgi:hypothetical protein
MFILFYGSFYSSFIFYGIYCEKLFLLNSLFYILLFYFYNLLLLFRTDASI